jgi:3-phosphoshikimate 1-carboxyvinyltransferase
MPSHATSPLDLTPVRTLRGRLRVPGDKSISHRYALFSGLARGDTTIAGLAPGADVAATIRCLAQLGVGFDRVADDTIRVRGRGWAGLRAPSRALDAANSGTTMRLFAGALAGRPFRSTLTGDESLSRRPMRRVIDPLTAMGASIGSDSGRAPLVIDGRDLHGIDWQSPVASAQVKTAILLAGLTARGSTSVTEPQPSRDHTERAFPAFGLALERHGNRCGVTGGQEAVAPSRPLAVPGDPSSAAVWAAAAAALPGAEVRLEQICLNPLRIGFIRALEAQGADVTASVEAEQGGEPIGTLVVRYGVRRPLVIGADVVPSLIDELPVLAASAALGGALEVSGAEELRVKESDRITALVTGLRTLGVDADERPDGFVIDGSRRPAGGVVDAMHDHRLVMAFALVALGATGPTSIRGAEVVAVSYPDFAADLARLTA